MPITSEYRAPKMMRENSSRPSWSTPRRCALDGPGQQPLTIRSRFVSCGSCVAISGAKIAQATKIATSTNPTTAPGFRISRYHASRQSPLGASSWIS